MRTLPFLRFLLCLLLSVSFLSVSFLCAGGPAWAEDTGHLRLQIQAPNDFNASIMINLVQDDVNTLLVAEPVNQYKIVQDVPAGTYQVDFIAADPYEAAYPKMVTVYANETAELPIQVKEPALRQPTASSEGPSDQQNPAKGPVAHQNPTKGPAAHQNPTKGPGSDQKTAGSRTGLESTSSPDDQEESLAGSRVKAVNRLGVAKTFIRQCGTSFLFLIAGCAAWFFLVKKRKDKV